MNIEHLSSISASVEYSASEAVDELPVDENVIFFDARGDVTGIDVYNTKIFGEPFDEVAALRALEWARAQVTATRAR